jgi:hypothetical protein
VPRTFDFAPTLTSAREAHAAGRLPAWSQWFNRDHHPNASLARGLLTEDFVYVLAEVRLRDLYPCSGPSPSFDYPDDPADYAGRVAQLARMFKSGWDAPPLFLHLPTLFLADGGHRRDALLRLGRETYWAVCWMTRPPVVGRGQHWGPRDG